MHDSDLHATRPPLASLATKIIVFVFVSTLATALLVSWVSIASTYAHLTRSLEVRYPATLHPAAEAVENWRAERPDAAEGPELVQALGALLAANRPDGKSRLLLAAADGRVLAASLPEDEPAPRHTPLPPHTRAAPAAPHDYLDADGLRAVGAAIPVAGTDWVLILEEPFEQAFAPVLTTVTRIFVLDLCVILFFSYMAYRLTRRALRPIEELSEAARRIASGDFDHEVRESGNHDEVGLLSRTFNDMMRRLRGYQSEIERANQILTERNAELQQAKETFEQLAITDGLTKLHNHRFFHDHLTREIKRVTRSGEPLAMLLADIDDFKRLNDRFGHAAGDELLLGMARIMNETVRESDLLARYGGEEFVVLASNTDIIGAYKLAEKIRMTVAEQSFILDDSLRPVRVTISIGVASFRGNRKDFFRAADRALYRAKAEGKNCVIVDEEET